MPSITARPGSEKLQNVGAVRRGDPFRIEDPCLMVDFHRRGAQRSNTLKWK